MKILLPIILIIVSVVLFFMQINPIYTDLKLLRVQAKEYDEALKIATELEQLRTELAKTVESFSDEDMARLDHFLPRRLDTVRIILDVDAIAKTNSIILENLDVDDSNATPPAQGNVPGYIGLNSVGLGFNFTSTYPQAIRFIQELEKSLRLLEVSSLSVAPVANSSGVYEFDMAINTFWINR